MFTPRGHVAGSFQHTLWPRNGASLYFSSCALQHAVDHSGQDSLTRIFFSSSNISVRTRGSLEQKQKYQSAQYKMQTAEWEFYTVFNLFSNSHHDKCKRFLITQLPKEGIYSISLESSHKLNSTVAIFNVQEIDTNLNRNTVNEPYDRLVFSAAIHQTGEHSPKNIKPERSWINSTKLNQKFQNRVITGLRSSSSGECVTNKVIYDVTYLYNCQRCLERCAPSDWSRIASYLAIIDSREMNNYSDF